MTHTISLKGHSGKTTPLQKGGCEIYVSNNDHSPLSPPARSQTITVIVE